MSRRHKKRAPGAPRISADKQHKIAAVAGEFDFADFSHNTDYKPHASQKIIHASSARFRLALCGRRFGKSTLAAYESAYAAIVPEARVWVVAPFKELATRVWRMAHDIFRYKFATEISSDRISEMTLRLGNDAELVGKTADNPDSLLGEGLDFVVLDEASRIRPGIFHRYILPSLADRRGRALLIGTPSGRGWLRELCDGADALPEVEVFKFGTAENPHVSPAELALQRRLLSDADYRREFLADFTADDALVYPMFDAALHTGEAKFRQGLPLFAGCDFGFTNPGCTLFAQVTPSESLVVLAEIYARGMTADEWAEAVLSKARDITNYRQIVPAFVYRRGGGRERFENSIYKNGVAASRANDGGGLENAIRESGGSAGLIVAAFCDPAGAGERAVFERRGIPTIGPRAGVEPGIVRVRALLEPADTAAGPRILIDRSCTNLLREFGDYCYDPDSPEPRVIKTGDHALDALRYLVVGLGL